MAGFRRDGWPSTVFTCWAVVLLAQGVLLATDRRARRRLTAWNRAYWSRRGRTAPWWCSYGDRFFRIISGVYIVAGLTMSCLVVLFVVI